MILIPWSTFWDRNYFAGLVPGLETLLGNAFVRGAVSGLGLVNVLAAIAELVDLFVGRGRASTELTDEQSQLTDRHVS